MLERIDRYIIKEQIGVGGQASVYLAHDPELNRDVAVKVPHQMASVQTGYLDALREEARRRPIFPKPGCRHPACA